MMTAVGTRLSRRIAVLALCAASVAAAGCADAKHIAGQSFTPATPGVLTVATSLPAPGFWEGTDADHLTGGFEFELARRLAQRWELELRIVDVPFDDLVDGDLHGADLALSQITATAERRDRLAFSLPYYLDDDGALLRAGEQVTDLKTAKELRWGAIVDSTQLDVLINRIRPDAEPLTFADSEAAVEAVASGRIDGALLDLSTALLASGASDAISTGGRIVVQGDIAIAMPPDSTNREVVDAALRALTADGTLTTLVDEYLLPRFETDPQSVPVIRLPD